MIKLSCAAKPCEAAHTLERNAPRIALHATAAPDFQEAAGGLRPFSLITPLARLGEFLEFNGLEVALTNPSVLKRKIEEKVVVVPPIKSRVIKTKRVDWLDARVEGRDRDGWSEPSMGAHVGACNMRPKSALLYLGEAEASLADAPQPGFVICIMPAGIRAWVCASDNHATGIGMKRPFVFANLAMTLDGKIAACDRQNLSIGSKADRLEMDRLRARADVVIWGGQTLRAARHPAIVREKSLAAERAAKGRAPHPANGVLTRGGAFPQDMPWFASEEVERFIFTTPQGASRLGGGRIRRARIVVLEEGDCAARQVLAYLARRGMRNVLLEGGGGLTWEFVRFIDEFHVTLTPWLAGGANAPTLMDGAGLRSGAFLGLRLMEVRRVEDELFLRYAANREDAASATVD